MRFSRRTPARLVAGALPMGLAAALLAPVTSAAPAAAPPVPTVDRQEETGTVGFIGAPIGQPLDSGLSATTPPESVATAFLSAHADQLGLASPETELQVIEQHPSSVGGDTVRVAQVHAGIPVLGGAFTVNLDEHRDVLSVLGEASPIGRVVTEPAVGARAAARAAIERVARDEGVRRGALRTAAPDLVLYDPRLLGAPGPFQTARLSWLTRVSSTRHAVAHTVVVDAAKGTVSLDFSEIAHARNRIVCDADNTRGHYPCTTPVWTETSQPTGVDADVRRAFDYAGDTYDFFASRFGRDSLDNAGMTLVSTVDYCPDTANCPFANAFWDGSQMVYGDGFASADDVVGHELAHGVTDFSSSLFYYMQSGAINESMSDIFGELIDLTNDSGSDDAADRWLMGEDIPDFGAIRDMQDPPSMGQPDRTGSPLYFGGEADAGGVHTNSGVSNKAAYLLADGGTFRGRTVGRLGLGKTARLFYTVNNDMLVSGSDFADLGRALRQACANLAGTGTGGFTAADCRKVRQAVLATEMDRDPANAPTSEPARCPAGTAPTVVHHDDLETPTGQLTIQRISGAEVWSYPQNPNDYPGFDATYATSGDTNIWGDNTDVATDSSLRMKTSVTVPAEGYLHFRHAFGFEDEGAQFYDGGVLEYSTSGATGPWTDAGALVSGNSGYTGTIAAGSGNPLAGRQAFVGESNGYGATRVDLTALAGEQVMFRWRIGTDVSAGDFGWFIDDISIVSCAGGTDTTPPDTRITQHPKGRTAKTRARFAFTSTETGSTFRCKFDRSRYRACASPKTYRVEPGKHVFRVRAKDEAGNRDRTPAVWRWRVRRR